MSNRPTLQDFIDDELLRAPLALDHVVDAVSELWRGRQPARSRHDADPARVLQQRRAELVSEALDSLRRSAQADLHIDSGHISPTMHAALSPPGLELSLIGEDDVAVDIEIARCTEAVRLEAEAEMRALQTYTSALVNDPNVSRDTNPFRPESIVRALWAGVQALPLSRIAQAAFMHDAAAPLAATLRKAYGAACQRLDDQGITPAIHRTIVNAGSSHWGAQVGRPSPADDLHELRDSLPGALGGSARGPAMPPASARPGADPQLIELLARLFDAVQNDHLVSADAVVLLQRLQPTALRVALREPGMLDSYEHPVWRFMDRLAHDIALSPPAQRLRLLGLGRNLVDHIASADNHDGSGFAWALGRLDAAQRHALAQATAAAAPNIKRLERFISTEVAANTGTMPLDIGSLDTVPADLLPASGSPAPAPGHKLPQADGLPPGLQLRTYLQGEWRVLISLWQDREHELALLHEPLTDRLWALRQIALARLASEGLLRPLQLRSLVRRAAEKVLRAL